MEVMLIIVLLVFVVTGLTWLDNTTLICVCVCVCDTYFDHQGALGLEVSLKVYISPSLGASFHRLQHAQYIISPILQYI